MGYDDDGSSLEKSFKSLCDFLFTVAIESGCWFVEENDFWIFEKDLCDSESLFLSSTESDSSFAYFCIEIVFQLVNELAFCHFYCFFDVFLGGCLFCSIEKIFSDSTVKD